jgi:hypothetical protein
MSSAPTADVAPAPAGDRSLGQLKVMSAIEQCRSLALGGHALRCSSCAQPQMAYNSCFDNLEKRAGVATTGAP